MEATWEEVGVIQKYYPNFDLEDKVSFNKRGIVRDSNIKEKCYWRTKQQREGHMAKIRKEGTPHKSQREKVLRKWSDYLI